MKKNVIGLIIMLSLFTGGCTKKIEKPIIFDQYQITLKTEFIYKEIDANTIDGSPAIKQYVQETETGFTSSVIIAKDQLQTGVDLEIFAENNIKTITKKITGIKDTDTDEFSFECDSEEVDGIFQEIVIEEGEQTQYLNQSFFIDKGYLYGISTMTIDKGENKNLAKSIQKISCPTTEKE